jgi:hypothetical protein
VNTAGDDAGAQAQGVRCDCYRQSVRRYSVG